MWQFCGEELKFTWFLDHNDLILLVGDSGIEPLTPAV